MWLLCVICFFHILLDFNKMAYFESILLNSSQYDVVSCHIFQIILGYQVIHFRVGIAEAIRVIHDIT